MAETKWKLVRVWKQKRQGQVWIVEDVAGQRGYFKFARPDQWYYAGPMVANELVAAGLARRLGLPVADLECAEVAGPDGEWVHGIVSKEVGAQEIITWKDAPKDVHRHPEQWVEQLSLLRRLIVFDAWIVNIDRAMGKNLILYRDDPHEKYHWYLIDHGNALMGSPRKWRQAAWNAPFWQRVSNFCHVPRGLLRLQSSWPALVPMIRKIERLSPSEIDAVLATVPSRWWRKRDRDFIRRLLLHRQRRLRRWMARWLRDGAVKEYKG